MTNEELAALRKELSREYHKFQEKDLHLDMSRGKPSADQLDLSMGMMDVLGSSSDLRCEDGTDCRNYGVLDGISEAKQLLADMMEVPPENIIIYGNSSLNVMYDTIARSYTHGVMGNTPWCRLDKVKFLCVVPGYDRHFAISAFFGMELISIPMLDDGPDMDAVRELVKTVSQMSGEKMLVFGVSADKDHPQMLRQLAACGFERVILTRAASSRALDKKQLLKEAKEIFAGQTDPDKITWEGTVAGACRQALAQKRPGMAAVIAGSLYIVGEALSFFETEES